MHFNFIMTKRGQVSSAGGAAILILVIAVMIILYILFLPPDERARILEEDFNEDNDDNSEDLDGEILLNVNPGRIDLVKKKEYEHKISSFNLLSKTTGSVIKEFNSVYVEKSLFSEQNQNFMFTIEDIDKVENVLLSFVNKEHSGRLVITLNNNIISEKEFTQTNPTPIVIPKSSIDKINELSFSASKPSPLLFLKTNKYNLENIKIVADITDDFGLENSQNFFISEIEKEYAEKAVLSFMSNCIADENGILRIILNNQEIYKGIPDCQIPIKLELSPTKILEGENKIKFSADKGSYVIDQAAIKTYLKDEVFQTYYFEVDDEKFELLEDDEIDLNMSLIFVANKDFQDIEVELNGRKFSIDNKERFYSEVIDPYIKKENNAITLRPLDGTVDIVELRIFVVDVD